VRFTKLLSEAKGKRQIIQSIIKRVRDKFNVAIAEVENGDKWQIATIGICYVSNDGRHANEVISKIIDYIVTSRLDVEVLDCAEYYGYDDQDYS
jgi:uncharacterized protein YlxP (DUF503 family)